MDTLPFTLLLRFEQTQRQLAEPRQVLRTVPGPMLLVVLAETHIQDLVQRVLDGPVILPSRSQVV